MNKKGTHIDWAISMGIFLVYVLSMFVLIQPGMERFYKEDNLLGIVEKGLKSPNAAAGGAYYNITKLPLRVDIMPKNPCPAGLNFIIDNPFGDIDTDDIRIVMPYVESKKKNITNFDVNSGTITFKTLTTLKYDDNPHFIDIYYSADAFPSGSLVSGQTCKAGIVTAGSIEQIFGLDPDRLGDYLSCTNKKEYDNLKKLWKFPAEKEFSLYYAETETLPYKTEDTKSLCNYGPDAFITPYDQSDVYAKEWTDWILDPSGELRPVIINARVW